MINRKKGNITPTKVLMIIDNLDQGGAQTLLVDLVTGINRANFQPLVCSLRNSSPEFLYFFEKAGVKVFQLGAGRLNPLKLIRLLRLIKKERIEVVHTHLTASRIIGVLAGKLGGVKKIFSHDHSGDEFLRKYPLLARYLLYPLDRLFMSFTERLFCVSGVIGRFNIRVKGIRPEKVEVVYNWIDAERFTSSPRWHDELRSRWQIPAGALVVGSVGRLSEEKGLRYLIKAAPIILEKCSQVFFVLVGDGGERQALEDLAVKLNVHKRIIFQGFMPDVEKAYSAFDVFVLPSVYETFGLVVLEAMTAGVPVVASATGGVVEILEDKHNGFLVPPRDKKALAAGVVNLIEHRETMAGPMVAKAKQLVKDKFDRKVAIDRIESFYRGDGV